MARRVFLAGAAGAIGARLVPLLVGAGYAVSGTTRSPAKAKAIESAGATAVIVDVFDGAALVRAVAEAWPEIVVHQLTDLPPGLDPARMAAATARNARIRDEGTRNLVAAARDAGARLMVAQSICWAYAPGPEPHGEDDPLDRAATGARAISVGGVIALETRVMNAGPLAGIVLRYGNFYGPGTGRATRDKLAAPLHVDDAAAATLRAIAEGKPGIFNIAEANATVAVEKARRMLGWAAARS